MMGLLGIVLMYVLSRRRINSICRMVRMFSCTRQDSSLLTYEPSETSTNCMDYEASDSPRKLWALSVTDLASKFAAQILSVYTEILTLHSNYEQSKLIPQHNVATISDRITGVDFHT